MNMYCEKMKINPQVLEGCNLCNFITELGEVFLVDEVTSIIYTVLGYTPETNGKWLIL